ncbi:MAG: type 4a pilus biogenesis protein PilO [Desulfococcaceae bacterium]
MDERLQTRAKAALREYRWVWLAWALLMVAGMAIHAGWVRPRAEAAAELQRAFLETRRELARVVEADSAVRRYLSAKEALQVFRRGLPEETALETLNAEVRELAAKHGLSWEPRRFRPEGMSELVVWRYALDLRLRAPYPRLKAFLADLGNSPSLFCVEEFALLNRANNEPLAELQLRLVTYARGGMGMQPLSG